jgi:acyl carrier protein
VTPSLRAQVRAVISEHVALPEDDEAPLVLESFVLVLLAEELEARFTIRVAAREVIPDHFGTVARLIAYVERKQREIQ